jgi:hypothetical protein
MARTAGFDDDLPAVMIGKNEGADLRMSGATTASASATFQEFVIEDHKDILAGFSSQGPTNVDYALKPDVTSVGVNVLNSITCVNKGPDCPGDGTVPSTVTVPANGSTTLTVTVSGGLTPHSIVQGWINLHGEDNNDLHFAYAAQVATE